MPRLDPDKIRFMAKMMSVAEELGASIEDDGAESFIDEVYTEYLAEGGGQDARNWLRTRLRGAFPSVGPRPRWIEAEPSWAYFEEQPMTFVGQVEVPDSASELGLAPETLYLFVARKQVGDGFELEYRVVSQLPGF